MIVGNHVWKVDESLGANAGLLVAGIELAAEYELFVLPEWIGAEDTGERQYYNSSLITMPYSQWTDRA